MLWRRLVHTCLIVIACLVGAPASAKGPVTLHRIVAVGDLHGDFAAWRDIAKAASLIDDQGRWIGGETVLVQVGDVVDRGPQSLNIIQDLMRLQREASQVGGRVVALVGNHEAMNVTGDLRYVSSGDYAAFVTPESEQIRQQVYQVNKGPIEAAYRKQNPTMNADAVKQAWLANVPLGQIEHQRAWRPEGPIGRWVIGNPAMIQLDDSLFVHGGVSVKYARFSIAKINQRVAAALARDDTRDDAIINDPDGPLWYRGLAMAPVDAPIKPDEDDAGKTNSSTPSAVSIDQQLDHVLSAYGVDRIVIGHTPILSGIAVLYQGKLIRIDTGISAFYGGKLSYLEIIDGRPVPHEVARSTPTK